MRTMGKFFLFLELIVDEITFFFEKIKDLIKNRKIRIALISAILILFLVILGFLFYLAVMRNAALKMPGQEFSITEFTKGLGDALKGEVKAFLAYGDRNFGEHILNILSLFLVSCLLYLIFWACTKTLTSLLGESRKTAKQKGETIDLGKLEDYETVMEIWKSRWWMIFALWMIFILFYLLISFVPIINNLQPILSPIYSDYGESYALAVAGLKNQILLLFGRTIEPNAQIGFWNNVLPTLKLIGKKVISTTTWLFFLGFMFYYIPWVIRRMIERYNEASEEIELIKLKEEKAIEELKLKRGIQALKAIRASTVR